MKAPVIGAVRRKGNVIARVVERANAETIQKFVNEAISARVSLICTDDALVYNRLRYRYKHGIVDHSQGQHVVGAIHTNTIEGFGR